MMKRFLLSLIVGATVASASADFFPVDFESGTLESAGWTTENSGGTKFLWRLGKYKADKSQQESTQFPTVIPILADGGESMLCCFTGGYFGAEYETAPVPDARIVSPAFEVADLPVLSFMFSANMCSNNTKNTPAAAKARFEIYVSPTGSDSKEAFTDTIYRETPPGKVLWKNLNLDLSAYKGKQIRIAMRCYMLEKAKNLLTNFIFIDNMNLIGSVAPDLEVVSIDGLTAGTIAEQRPTVKVLNHGSEAKNFSLTMSATGADEVTEFPTGAIAMGDTLTYTFANPLVLRTSGTNRISVSALIETDSYSGNNSLSADAYLFPKMELPFVMADSIDAIDDFTSTGSGSRTIPDGWQFMERLGSWVFTFNTKQAFLFTNSSMHLKEGTVRVSFGGNYTGEHQAKMRVYITRLISDFGQPVGEAVIEPGDGSGVAMFQVKEEGDYIIAIRAEEGESKKQYRLTSLKIDVTDETPDVALMSVAPSQSLLADTESPISVTYRNLGGAKAESVKLAYTIGDLHEEETAAPAEIGATATHTFKTPVSLKAGEHKLTIVATTGNDFNTANDTISTTLTVYSAKSLPFADSFEKEADAKLWTAPGNSKWFRLDGYQFDGTHIMALSETTDDHNDWLISPAVNIPAGYKGRVSFYYGSGGNAGTAKVRAFLTESTEPAEILKSGIELRDLEAGGKTIDYTSQLIDVARGGVYYVAILAYGGNQSLLLDDVRIDATEEVAAIGVDLSTIPSAAYSHPESTITLRALNCGRETLKNAGVAYTVLLTVNGKQETLYSFEETSPVEVAAGSEFSHTFSKKLAFDREGIYTVQATVNYPSDADKKNNSYAAIGPEVLATMQLPALWDMELTDYLHGYVFDNLDMWKIGSVNPYSGSRALAHIGGVKNWIQGDNVVLNRVYLPAGDYQFSFFWHTLQNQTGANYAHTFDVMLGTSPDPLSMTRKIMSVVNQTAEEKLARKEMADLNISESGYYWVAFKLLQAGSMGNISLDNVRIEKPEAAVSLLAENASYTADFAGRGDEWQHYHPIKMQAQQWDEITEGGTTYLEAKEFTANEITYRASYIQAPSFGVAGGKEYEVEVDYEILPLDADHPLSGNETIEVFASARDLPKEFASIGSCKSSEKKAVFKTTPGKDGLMYISLRPAGATDGIFRLRGFKARRAGMGSVDTAASDCGWTISGNRIMVDGSETVRVFSVSGVEIATATSGSIDLEEGNIYVILTSKGAVKVSI